MHRDWWNGRFGGTHVTVPDSVNPTPVSGPGVDANYYGSVAWYRTTFDVPRAGGWVIHFGSVNFRASVWLDGRRLGTHIGEYLPFEYRVRLAAGTHTLVVRDDWRDPSLQSREGFHRTWFNFGGIDREVTVRPIGPSELSSPWLGTTLQRTPDGSTTARVRVSVQVRNDGPARALAPAGTLEGDGHSYPIAFSPQTLGHGRVSVYTSSLTIADPQLWGPGHPNLYELRLAVGGECSYRARVGLRQVQVRGGRIYLNGAPLQLRGASLQEEAPGHGDALTPADQDRIVSELRAIGADATRSQHPIDPGLMERLDAAGIVDWQGIGPVDSAGNWTSSTPQLMRLAESRVEISAREAWLDPSVITWNLANEIADNGHPGGQAQYIERAADWLHSNDPSRLVAVDVWGEHPPHYSGPLYANLDAVSETDYAGWYDDPLGSRTQIDSLIDSRVSQLRAVLPGKALLVSEFGAEANGMNPAPGLGSYAYQAGLLTHDIHAFGRQSALSGMLVWNLRDFAVTPTFAGGRINSAAPTIQLVKGIDQKGLFAYDGRAKPAVAAVRGAFASLR